MAHDEGDRPHPSVDRSAVTDASERARAAEIEDTAAAWLARLRAAEPGDQAEFEVWYAADQAHADTYYGLLVNWRRSAAAGELRHLRQHRSETRPAPWWALVAACLVAVLAVSWLAIDWYNRHRPVMVASLIEASPQALLRFALTDGSRIILDVNSAIDTAAFVADRRIKLVRGRARFHVAPGSERTFTVATAAGLVRATGTMFDLAVDGPTTQVAMIEGSVALQCEGMPGRAYRLTAGQAISIAAAGPQSPARSVVRDSLGWTAGIQAFDNTMLSDVAAAITSAGFGTIVVDDPAARSLRFTGTLRPGDVAGTARLLARTFQLRVRRDAAGVLHLSRP